MQVIKVVFLTFMLTSCAFFRMGSDRETKEFSNDVQISQFVDMKWTPIVQINKGESSKTSLGSEREFTHDSNNMVSHLNGKLGDKFVIDNNESNEWKHYVEIEVIDSDDNFETRPFMELVEIMTIMAIPQVKFRRKYILRSLFTHNDKIVCETEFQDEVIRVQSFVLFPVGLFFSANDPLQNIANNFANNIHENFHLNCVTKVKKKETKLVSKN